jgi:hypothetical protein
MFVPPPGRLSTITLWPIVSVSFWAIVRATKSEPPPATYGQMMRIGRVGYV